MNQVYANSAIEAAATVVPNTGLFDWTRGVTGRGASTVTRHEMQPICLKTTSLSNAYQPPAGPRFLTEKQFSEKVVLLINLSHACRVRVPELLAREAAVLGAADFARLMLALEKNSEYSFEDERFCVFRYADGVVGSVWLYGEEVYNLPRRS